MSGDTVGLASLEQQVARVVAELERLRQRNGELEAEVERLTTALESAPGDSDTAEEQAWKSEREGLRRRVSELVATLEGLLGTGDAGPV